MPTTSLAAFLAFGSGFADHIELSPPTIVVIFIGDMGYMEIGPFGSFLNDTAHLNRC